MADIINANDTPDYPIRPANGQRFTLAELETLLRSEVRYIDLGGNCIMVVSESGEPNKRATWLAGHAICDWETPIICGNAIFASSRELPLIL